MASVKNKQLAAAGRKANKKARLLPLHDAQAKQRKADRTAALVAWSLKYKRQQEATEKKAA